MDNNDLVFSVLSKSHPGMVLLYSAWNYGDIYPKLEDLLAKLRALKIPRIVIVGPPPE